MVGDCFKSSEDIHALEAFITPRGGVSVGIVAGKSLADSHSAYLSTTTNVSFTGFLFTELSGIQLYGSRKTVKVSDCL